MIVTKKSHITVHIRPHPQSQKETKNIIYFHEDRESPVGITAINLLLT